VLIAQPVLNAQPSTSGTAAEERRAVAGDGLPMFLCCHLASRPGVVVALPSKEY
jgi:hypothetical protein